MASPVPAALKTADISRFVQRAAQVEKARPAVAYWCNYWAANQILSKGLHASDGESAAYLTKLLDKLEQTKAKNPSNDAIADDVAGQAYVEQFGLETFQRADNAVRATKASRQTADTFLAAATFLELSHIWGPLNPDIASKIKFAKYHALRIAKALKAGEDPNLSNPAPEPLTNLEQLPPLDPNDPEVRMLNGSGGADATRNGARQPFVEDVPDEHDRLQSRLAQHSSMNQSLHPSRASSVPRSQAHHSPDSHGVPSPQEAGVENFYHGTTSAADVSPLAPSPMGRKASDGGYFPRIPDDDRDMRSLHLPESPPRDPGSPPVMDLPDAPPLPPAGPSIQPTPRQPHFPPTTSFQSFPPPKVEQPRAPSDLSHLHTSNAPHPQPFYSAPPPTAPSEMARPPQQSYQSQQAPTRNPAAFQPTAPIRTDSPANYMADEEAVLKAQKHARWAISALNFEDINTAVKELRGALEALGAR
ncbi:Vacuolar protein sorting-associate protein Vta1/Callose synthase, N-terminal domain [Lasallia pustulata]|uniref:Vacuolar protein sorting-associate protein Vta1/Callose synthase, N-terminal domain n=1 Tax=Lasallia pustulata TaxID=136370 RepID=A0A1W5DAJ1_9LECA|nr:Vacuolar protein sorting-associate protein Vta1/Callose synthase, N-terminal domain [Lasallia pustulata]